MATIINSFLGGQDVNSHRGQSNAIQMKETDVFKSVNAFIS